ncbi:ATP-binding protein [Sphingomonas alpina]|uniref:histidine kinase n=1 Tax=Sphingomonas alpina TaxID=653931 RepID=A0A7H0LLK1_9SPHN|nr:ATP-binding protein [Sphingomonas alpina]QNQ10554.1 CHASE3 domain-containing protein [Sphingomonas alpina]
MSGIEGEIEVSAKPPTPWRTIMLVVVALLGAIVLVALIVTLGEANRQRDRAIRAQSHSYEVMILARTLSGTIARSEASLGRYVISADKSLGRLYFDEWQLAGQQITRLDQVTNDNPPQQARIDALRRAYNARGAELSLTALSTNYGQNNQALARYYQARKAISLTEINQQLDGIIAQERLLLDRRTGAAMRSVDQSNSVAKVLVVFGILIVLGAIALGWLTVEALGQRASARAEAEAERERAHELEEAVTQATAELRQQEGKLRQVQKMEAVGQLTGGIAHDFNNMLAVVLGGLELAKRQLHNHSSPALRHIESAMEGANRAAALTRQLLAFSREESLRLEPIAAGELITGMSDLLDRTLGDAITVVARDIGRGWLTHADRHQLENVILNLAVNARDAMEGRGTLTIVTSGTALAEHAVGRCPAGEYVTIAVSDTGCGMTPEVMERVFEPFFTTKPVGKGTGLGLSQIFAFVRQAEGEIGLQSEPGKGTTVTLYLPRDATASVSKAEQIAAVPEPVAPLALDILVVEDDERVLAATMGALEELGHRAIACGDPLAAPALLQSTGHIDLIMSDVLMPGQTGPEMIAALAPDYRHVAVLFVTGFAGEASEAEFGGHHVLRKPFTMAALERGIVAAMAVERPAAPHSIAAE